MKNKKEYYQILEQQQMMQVSTYAYFELCHFKKGDCLLHQGQQLSYLYILLEGCIKSCHTTSNGSTVLTAFSNALTVIGEVEFLNHREVINDIYAIENIVCLRICVSKYEEVLLNDLLFIRYLAKVISCKLYETNQNSSISMNYPVENRLASYLISCHDNLIITENFVQVAKMIGCSYRQLQRVLNTFCKLGYLSKIQRGQFKICNPKALQKLGQDLYYL